MSATETVHKVKLAVIVPGSRSKHVVECVCGWSSALHWSAAAANKAYADHKAGV